MESTVFRELLDALPMCVVWVQDAQTAWLNAPARAQISPDATAFTELCARTPELFDLSFGTSSPPRRRIFLGDKPYHVSAYDQPDGKLILLLAERDELNVFPEMARLRQSCLDLEEIFRNSFDGIFVADGDGITLMVNEGCERNYDLTAADMVGKHVSEFDQKGWIRPVVAAKVAESGQRITTTQHTHTGKTIMVTGIPLFDSTGKVRKVIINSRDTTELIQLQNALARAQEDLRRVDEEMEALRLQNLNVDGVLFRSEAMRAIVALAARVAKVDTTVLITGQSGVGKDVIGRLIHRESRRANGPLIKINCGALPRDLLESELFGYEPGAFTGAQRQVKLGLIELAHRGTLFLDEVGDLPSDIQVKLLQVLQDRVIVRLGGTRTIPVDVRIVAATNRDLKTMVLEKTFRDDLYYRLNVVPIHVPPLCERKDDVVPLILQFVGEFNGKYELNRSLSERSIALLLAYDWPGNVREVRNVVERLVVTSQNDVIEPEFLDGLLPSDMRDASIGGFRDRVERFERRLIEDALRKHANTREVAKALGLSQSSVVRKLRRGNKQ